MRNSKKLRIIALPLATTALFVPSADPGGVNIHRLPMDQKLARQGRWSRYLNDQHRVWRMNLRRLRCNLENSNGKIIQMAFKFICFVLYGSRTYVVLWILLVERCMPARVPGFLTNQPVHKSNIGLFQCTVQTYYTINISALSGRSMRLHLPRIVCDWNAWNQGSDDIYIKRIGGQRKKVARPPGTPGIRATIHSCYWWVINKLIQWNIAGLIISNTNLIF